MIENTNTKQFYPGPILNNTLEITDFLFNDVEQIKVKHSKLNDEGVLIDIDLDYPTDYEVIKVLPSDINAAEAALTASTGQVMLKNVNVLAGEKLTVYRVSQIIQDVDYPRTGAFPAAAHEGALDYLTMQNQEQQEQISRSLKIPNSVETFDAQMPTPLPARALKINADGTGFEMSEFDPDVVLITTEKFKNQAQQAAIEALTSQNVATEQADISTEQANIATEQANIATEQATIATEQATIATNKASEVVESGNTALSNIDTAKNNAIKSITNQETTSKTSLINEGATQIGLIQNEGATQVANVQSTGFYMRDDKLYYINSQGEETEFKSGGSGLELCDIGMALYIDETKGLRRYLNGQIVDINANTQAFLDRLKQITTLYPSLLTTEENWQAAKTMSAFGQVGKFVFNYADDGATVVSVRIPRVVNVQGLFDLQNLGMTVGAGLPNITGKFGTGNNNGSWFGGVDLQADGCFRNDIPCPNPNQYLMGNANGSNTKAFAFDASRSNSIYGNSDTVQQEAIKYRYFIQIATGSETENNIINDIELNNPYSLFDSKYSDHELNNLSWLKSEGQWNAKSVYTDAYDKLLKVYNGTETVEGLSVKLSTEEYTDYDFVLNTAEESFRLPIDTIDHPINSTGTLPVVGNGMALGLTDGTRSGSTYGYHNGSGQVAISTTFGVNVGRPLSADLSSVSGKAVGVTTDPTKSGIVADLTSKKANLYLYFYVGETVQNANLIDAGRIGEQLSGLVEVGGSLSMPSNKYIDLTLGASGTTYTAPANGWFFCSSVGVINMILTNQEFSLTITGASGYAPNGYMPVKKGEKFIFRYSNNESNKIRFFYAQGDV